MSECARDAGKSPPFRLPLEREDDPLERILSTHPPTDERIERLAERARGRRVPIE